MTTDMTPLVDQDQLDLQRPPPCTHTLVMMLKIIIILIIINITPPGLDLPYCRGEPSSPSSSSPLFLSPVPNS